MILEKNIKLTREYFNKFINLSLASASIKEIIIKEKNKPFSLRPNINLFIYGDIGSSKSTILKEISKKTGCLKAFTDLTYPALIGSIDKITRQILVGSCWDCRNSLMLLDEFNFSKKNKDDIRALLQLIEGGEYNRKVASFSSPIKKEDEDLSYSFNEGTFDIKTRFSLIIATMKYPYFSQNIELKALVTRSITLPFNPTPEELKEIARGFPIFNFKKIVSRKKIIISNKDYEFILNFYEKNTSTFNNYLRIIGDCCRVFAIIGKHERDLYRLIIYFGNKKFKNKVRIKK